MSRRLRIIDGVKNRVWERLDDILSDRDSSGKLAHLSSDERKAVREILSETCPDTLWTNTAAGDTSVKTRGAAVQYAMHGLRDR